VQSARVQAKQAADEKLRTTFSCVPLHFHHWSQQDMITVSAYHPTHYHHHDEQLTPAAAAAAAINAGAMYDISDASVDGAADVDRTTAD